MFNNRSAIKNLKKYENKLSDSLYFTTHKNGDFHQIEVRKYLRPERSRNNHQEKKIIASNPDK